MEDDGHTLSYENLIAPSSRAASFAKPLNRSVIGSMNDLILRDMSRSCVSLSESGGGFGLFDSVDE
jgi:hypothetical protein